MEYRRVAENRRREPDNIKMCIRDRDITFNVKALVNFVTNGKNISAEDTEGSFEIRIEDTPVVNAAEFRDRCV